MSVQGAHLSSGRPRWAWSPGTRGRRAASVLHRCVSGTGSCWGSRHGLGPSVAAGGFCGGKGQGQCNQGGRRSGHDTHMRRENSTRRAAVTEQRGSPSVHALYLSRTVLLLTHRGKPMDCTMADPCPAEHELCDCPQHRVSSSGYTSPWRLCLQRDRELVFRTREQGQLSHADTLTGPNEVKLQERVCKSKTSFFFKTFFVVLETECRASVPCYIPPSHPAFFYEFKLALNSLCSQAGHKFAVILLPLPCKRWDSR